MRALLRATSYCVIVVGLAVGCGSGGKGTDAGSSGVVHDCDAGCGAGYTCGAGAYCYADTCAGTIPEGTNCLADAGDEGFCCNHACVDYAGFDSDPNNCGYCGQLCPTGTTCSEGECGVDGGYSPCSDSTVCPSGTACLYGTCIDQGCTGAVAGATCLFSATREGACCGGTCVDSDYDPQNCGTCDFACGAGSFCNEFDCAPIPDCATAPGAECQVNATQGGSCCGGTCLDLEVDPNNCGTCGFGCPTGATCNGFCTVGDAGVECTNATCGAGLVCREGGCVQPSCAASAEGLSCALGTYQLGTCCGATCFDTSQDSSNCGDCGRVCPTGTFCNGGACEVFAGCVTDAGAGATCPISPTLNGYCCGTTCANVLTDALNCSLCGDQCETGATCVAGSCMQNGQYAGCSNSTCPAGATCVGGEYCEASSCTGLEDETACAVDANQSGLCCSGSCSAFAEDSSNCGFCGNVCPTGTFCGLGSCLTVPDCAAVGDAGAAPCPIDPTHEGECCAGACTAVNSDSTNCGACGAECPVGANCLEGYCVQGDGGTSEYCESLGATCPTGTTCVDGICAQSTCVGQPDGQECALANGDTGLCCGAVCVDAEADADHCGNCGTVCASDEFCSEDTCTPSVGCAFDGGQIPCQLTRSQNGVCCGTSCLDLSSDATSCGACGVACPTGVSCAEGNCGSSDCETQGCPSGDTCVDAECFAASCAGRPDEDACATASALSPGNCCGELCVDQQQDSSNCGSCGVVCGSGSFCFEALCVEAPTCGSSGTENMPCAVDAAHSGKCCGSTCADLNSDASNCGSCGFACGVGVSCQLSQCTASCNQSGCPAGTQCTGVICGALSCAGLPDTSGCSLQGAPGICCGQACVDSSTDNDDCGACGHTCASGSFCSFGGCQPFAGCTFDGGQASCPVTGGGVGQCCGTTCVAVTTDDSNCGRCGNACPTGASCDNGGCLEGGQLASCATGGCPNGDACVSEFFCASPTCAGLADGIECATGDNTDGTCCGGSCIDPLESSLHCGVCGNSCATGTFCNEGQCAPIPNCADAGASACPFDAEHLGICCGGSCLDPTSNPLSCGGCGYECAEGALCQDSQCVTADGGLAFCEDSSCPGGTTCAGVDCFASSCTGLGNELACVGSEFQGICCEQACVSSETDATNCGGCGVSCPHGQYCNFGFCTEIVPCAADAGSDTSCFDAAEGVSGFCCGASCADLQTDPTNCGTCGFGCDLYEDCVRGLCQEKDGGTDHCTGDAGCAAGLDCIQGAFCLSESCAGRADGFQCTTSGAVNLLDSCCGGACLDTFSDSSNCGTCGRACSTGEFCFSGNCQPVPNCADAGGANCPLNRTSVGVCCGGGCRNANDDANNCGGCGLICATGVGCVGGYCMLDGGGLGFCGDISNPCPNGTTCTGLACEANSCTGASDATGCDLSGGGGQCCGQQCIAQTAGTCP